jgi:predicted AAA+ superfamily ATPase
MRDWLELTAERDILMFPRLRLDPDLCLRILEVVPKLESPDQASISKAVRQDGRKVASHLKALLCLYALHELKPHPASIGKPLYFLCDVGLATVLGADFERRLWTWLIVEQLSQRSVREDRAAHIYYYRSARGGHIHLVVAPDKGSPTAVQIFDTERINERDLERLRAFRRKLQGDAQLMGFGASRQKRKDEQIDIFPWESIV